MPNTNRVYRVAVIPGDGIGKEVVPEGVRAIEAVSKKFGFDVRQDWFDFASYDYYAKHERMAKVLKTDAVRTKLANLGLVLQAGSPAELAETVKDGLKVRGELVKAAGIQPE